MSQWKKAKNKLIESPVGSRRNTSTDDGDSLDGGRPRGGSFGSLEGADPELCITLMERRLNFNGLKNRLKKADQTWMEQFLAIGGLSAIFDALQVLGQKGFSSITDALRQLECVGCIKAVMNNRFGLEFIIQQPGEGFVKKLAQVLDTNNGLVKTQVFELLSALCVYSEEGYKLALDALDDYKRTKSQRYRFSLLINELKASETQEYSACVLAFINCILGGATDLSQRLKLRNEFIALQLLETLSPWRHTADDALATQIDVFEDSHADDNAQLDMPGGVDINSHEDMYNALFAKVCNTPNALPFLHVLQSLLLLERDSEKASAVWELIEQFCQQAVLMENPAVQAEKAMIVGVDKLKAVLQEEENRQKQQSLIPAAPPPPPPPPGGPPLPPSSIEIPVPPPLPPGGPGIPPPPPPPLPGGVPMVPPPPPPPPGGPGIPPPPPPPPGGVPMPPPLPGGVPMPPPPPGGVPMPPPLPGGVPMPPPPPGGLPGFGHAAFAVQAAVSLTPFEKARKHKPKKQMRKVNWTKVPKNVATKKSALWHFSSQQDADSKVDIDATDMEELFSRAEVKKKEKKEEEKSKQPSVVSLLDQKASLNVNIFLKQFKTDNGSIVTMLRDGDTSRISIDQLKALEKLLPDDGTVEMIKSYKGDRSMLGTAEDFFKRLLEVKHYQLRVEALQLKLEFHEKLEDLRPAIKTLEEAIDELLSCAMLSEVFHVALMAGNIINGGGRAGDAYGITVSSLNKLKDTKSKVPRMSLLHYICEVCEKQAPELLVLKEQLPHLERASKLSYDFLSGEISGLKSKVEKLEKRCKKAPDDLKAQLKSFLGEAKQTLDDFQSTLDAVKKKMMSVAEYFCQDASKFKLEELLVEILTFVNDYEKAQKENVQRKVVEEKRRKREEAKKKADEEKRKRLAAKGKTPPPEEPEEEGCVIDNLLKEIRAGTTLKSTRRQSSRKSVLLKREELDKLNLIVATAALSPRAAKSSKEFQFPTPDSGENKPDDAALPSEQTPPDHGTDPPVAMETSSDDHTPPDRVMSDEKRVATSPSGGETAAESQSPGLPVQSAAQEPVATETNSDDHGHLSKVVSESTLAADDELPTSPATEVTASVPAAEVTASVPATEVTASAPAAEESTTSSTHEQSQNAANQPVTMETKPNDHTPHDGPVSNRDEKGDEPVNRSGSPTISQSAINQLFAMETEMVDPTPQQEVMPSPTEDTSARREETSIKVQQGPVETNSHDDDVTGSTTVSGTDGRGSQNKPTNGETATGLPTNIVEQSIVMATANKVMNGTGRESRESSMSPETVATPMEDSLYRKLVKEVHGRDVQHGVGAMATTLASLLVPGLAEELSKSTTAQSTTAAAATGGSSEGGGKKKKKKKKLSFKSKK